MGKVDIKLLNKIKVLYVEDELNIQAITYETFNNLFHTVTAASNGLEARRKVDGRYLQSSSWRSAVHLALSEQRG